MFCKYRLKSNSLSIQLVSETHFSRCLFISCMLYLLSTWVVFMGYRLFLYFEPPYVSCVALDLAQCLLQLFCMLFPFLVYGY